MTLQDIIANLNLTIVSTPKNFSTLTPTGGYASDLLSCVMAGAKPGDLWITIQAHINIVAVAALNDVSAIIIAEGANPEPNVIEKANEQGVTLLVSQDNTYHVVGKLWEMGIR